jgi:hypothetical protein
MTTLPTLTPTTATDGQATTPTTAAPTAAAPITVTVTIRPTSSGVAELVGEHVQRTDFDPKLCWGDYDAGGGRRGPFPC